MRRRAARPDLRLVPPVVAGWAATWAGLSLPPRLTVPVASAVAGCALLWFFQASRRTVAHPLDPEPLAVPICAALLISAGLALAAGLHVMAAQRGPLHDLARWAIPVDATVTVTGDPRHIESPQTTATVPRYPARPDLEVLPVRIDTVVVAVDPRSDRDQTDAQTDAQTETPAPGTAYQLGAAVTVFVRLRRPSDLAVWSELLPSTRLQLHGRLGPARPGTADAAVLMVDRPPQVVGGPSAVQGLAGRLRADLRDAVSGLPAESAGVLPALAVGDTSQMPAPLAADLKRTGLTYLTVVSGENLMFLSAALLPAARRMGLRGRTLAAFGGLLTLGFTILARPGPPMVRATVMALFGWAAIATGRRSRALSSMAAAVLILLLLDPWLAKTYGFALSVAATAGLVITAPGWRERLLDRGLPDLIAFPAAATAAAELYCEPLLVTFTGSLPLLAIPANVLAVPAAPLATVIGVTAMAADAVWRPAGHLVAWVGQWPVHWICLVAHTGAAVPGGTVGWPRGPTGPLALLLVYLAVGWAVPRAVHRFLITIGLDMEGRHRI
jgi:ComEC/Rec2-related protein